MISPVPGPLRATWSHHALRWGCPPDVAPLQSPAEAAHRASGGAGSAFTQCESAVWGGSYGRI